MTNQGGLFYRLNTVYKDPAARRGEGGGHFLLFRKVCCRFREKYRMPSIRLSNEAKIL
jgi:hypothetical protein